MRQRPQLLDSTPRRGQIPLRHLCPLETRKIFKYGTRGALKALAAWTVVSGFLLWGWLREHPEMTVSQHLYQHLPLLIGIVLLFSIAAFAHPVLYFLIYHYEIDEKNVVIRKGIFAKREIILPFSRITDVNVEQDWFDVVLGLYDIHISSPTAESGKFAHIDGVNRRSALTIRKILIERLDAVDYEQAITQPASVAQVAHKITPHAL